MNYRLLKEEYYRMKELQAEMYGKEFKGINKDAADVVFNTATVAMRDVEKGSSDVSMRAVSLSTGLGKSTSAYALIAAGYKTDPDFSAAYVVPTVKMAIEAQEGIEKLLGEGSTVLWSTYHKDKNRDTGKAFEELGFVPQRTVNARELGISRIIIITHHRLRNEIRSKSDLGCARYLGKPRSIVFVDEHPDLLETVSTVTANVQELLDTLNKHNNEHEWSPVLRAAITKMNEVTATNGQTYVPITLLTRDEGKLLENGTLSYLMDLTDEDISDDVRRNHAQKMRDTVLFLIAASQGCAFYSRQDLTFFAYRLDFEPDYPGYVLLDATSDITGLVTLHPNIERVEVPQVDYSPLEIFHIDHPRQFKNVSKVVDKAVSGRAYGKWIKETVIANTQIGDDVLVVVHKAMLDLEHIEGSSDINNLLDWEGRRVNTQNWGAGVGLNTFKDKTHVFLFGEFYPLRAKTISEVHGWSGVPLSDKELKLAKGRRQSGNEYAPQGRYLEPYEGHLLRWTKQLSMRGRGRNVDTEGKCYPMKLYTSMDRSRLLTHYDRLFPKALPPKPTKATPSDTRQTTNNATGRREFERLLMVTNKALIGADEIQAVTGIPTSKLSREFTAIEAVASKLGWRTVSAKEVNKPGKMKYLVNDSKLGRTVFQAA